MVNEKQNSGSLVVPQFWEPYCEHCASVSWRELPLQAASVNSLKRASQNHYFIAVNCKTQMYFFCVGFMQTVCMSLKIWGLFWGWGREKILHSFIFSFFWCILVFSVWLFVGRHFFCWECCVGFHVCTGIYLQYFHPSAVFQYSLHSASALRV